MDMLYDNLENFRDEATNAELREENGNLKTKLEEYAKAFEQLQKDFDTLVLEHKKLELNYSSLLKTAKSEIERKTQIITKLNIEKDEIVLNSIQNRNTRYNRQKPMTNEPKNKVEPGFRNTSQSQCNSALKSDSGPKPSHQNQATNERNINTRHSDVNKSVVNTNIDTARNDAVKENVILKDEQRSRAKIFQRRKSMPVSSMECSKFSSDEEEVASSASSKEFVPKEPSDKRYPDRYHRDKPIVEHRTFGHYPWKNESKSHFSKYDSFKYRNQDNYEQSQKYKRNQSSDRKRRSPDRKIASLERRRGSPDGKRRDFRNYTGESHKRHEYDRYRRVTSPSKDKYHDSKHRSRDSQHSNERYSKQEIERNKSRSQDKYITKHKIMHDFEESSNKRMRIDSFPNHEEDRWRVDRQAGPASLEMDALNMSCQSPDQSHFDAHSSHQTREIKLEAVSTQLDDPRLSSQKYCLKTHDGKAELFTVDSANIVVKVIDSSTWDTIKTVKMPDALLTKPVSPEVPNASFLQRQPDTLNASLIQKASEIRQQDNQKPTSSGSSDAASSTKNVNKSSKIKENQKILTKNPTSTVPKSNSTDMPDILSQNLVISSEESKLENLNKKATTDDDLVKEIYMDIENPISNTSIETSDVYNFDDNFHNPEDSKNIENTSDFTSKTELSKDEQPSNPKKTKRSSGDKQTDITHKGVTIADDNTSEKTKHTLKSKLAKRCSSDFENYISAKEIIAGDLELSDETSDNTDMPIPKQKQFSKAKEVSETKDSGSDSDKKITTNKTDTKFGLGTSSKKVEDNNLGEITDNIILDVKKSKARKKSFKLKESKESRGLKEDQISGSKPAKKHEITQKLTENANTSMSLDELVKIKENISKELANQPILLDKQIKKKENKSKTEEIAVDVLDKQKEIQPIIGIKDTVLSSDKPGPIKKKDYKSVQQLFEKKETAFVEKQAKKKEIKKITKPNNDISLDKNKSNLKESSTNIIKESINKKLENKDDQYKTKTKFNELFGDSSSLVSPEDLGLVPIVAAPSENYIAMFEDAQDAIDMNSVRTISTTEPTKKTNEAEIKAQINFSINKPVIPVEPTYEQKDTAHTESLSNTSFSNQAMYQNLQPEFQQDSNIVKTVIISSGVQPQCTLDATGTYPLVSDNKDTDLHVMQCVKPTILQNIALQALATSTPQKTVQIEEPSVSSRCENQEVSIVKAPTATSLSNAMQSNTTDEPDVTIFVKRRRKVLKKK